MIDLIFLCIQKTYNMKNVIWLIELFLLVVLPTHILNAQVDATNHNYVSTHYVGWSSNNTLDFRIGTSVPTPLQMELLSNGLGLNLYNSTSSYRIGAFPVLQYANSTSNIFVGVSSGS